MSFSEAEQNCLQTHLYELCRRPNPSGFEDLVRAYVVEHLTACHFSVEVDAVGNVTAWRGVPAPEEGYPLLSFHMDSVTLWGLGDLWEVQAFPQAEAMNGTPPWQTPLLENGILHSDGRFILGGDDKCGAAIALTIAAFSSWPLKIVASVQEETGCHGIACVSPAFFADVSYALVLDRRGRDDLITSIRGYALCDSPFALLLVQAAAVMNHRVHVRRGMLSDALFLSRQVDNVANVSVGYYSPHSSEEYVVMADLLRAYQWVQSALRMLPRPRPLRSDPSSRAHPLV